VNEQIMEQVYKEGGGTMHRTIERLEVPCGWIYIYSQQEGYDNGPKGLAVSTCFVPMPPPIYVPKMPDLKRFP
jgi:hypothetical protein